MPVPTGDLEAASQATGAPDIIAYSAIAPSGADGEKPDKEHVVPHTFQSFGWARARNAEGAMAEAWLQTGESYAFTATSSIRAVEETLARSLRGALSPAAAFGEDFVLTVPGTTRTDAINANMSPTKALQEENLE
jgi:hypothetical protein